MILALRPKKTTPYGVLGGGNGLKVRLYPNGECVVYKPKSFKLEPIPCKPSEHVRSVRMAFFRLCCEDLALAEKIGYALGLSPLPIFDTNSVEDSEASKVNSSADSGRARKGLRGITPHGARMVRNAAYLLERELGRARCVFATVTVPNLPMHQMRRIHEQWHQIVERYRLNIRRLIERHGLRCEMVTVSEIQEKRYERTGLPVLHLHSVFGGKTFCGHWAMTVEEHDEVWRRALNAVDGVHVKEVPSSCNLQRVKKSAECYLGKYMTKGCKVVSELSGTKFEGWIPKHWWNCTRSLRSRIDQQTRFPHSLGDWLEYCGASECCDVWQWHRLVEIEMGDGQKVAIARYGKLTQALNQKIIASLYKNKD